MNGDKLTALHARLILAKPLGQMAFIGACKAAFAVIGIGDIGHGLARGAGGNQISQKRFRQGCAHGFHKHADAPAAGQTNSKGLIIRDAKLQHLRLARLHSLHSLDNHRAFDAAARDRALHLTIARDNQLAAHRPRSRAPCLHHGGKGRAFACAIPIQRQFRHVFEHLGHRVFLLGPSGIEHPHQPRLLACILAP